MPRADGPVTARLEADDAAHLIAGRWAWGSGVEHSDWVMMPVFCDGPPLIRALVPASEVILHDNWHTLGMRGTGSCDYELDDVFVPDRFAIDLLGPQHMRGGALHRLGLPGYVINEHDSFAYALGRLALQTMSEAAIEKKRGYLGAVSIADRQVFQRVIGQSTIRMNACAAGMAEAIEAMFDSAAEGPPDPALVTEAQAVAVWCTDEAIDVVSGLFRYADGSAVMLANDMQRILRDIYTVQSHLMVTDAVYERYGRVVLGLEPGGGLP